MKSILIAIGFYVSFAYKMHALRNYWQFFHVLNITPLINDANQIYVGVRCDTITP
jgi:hypothetical protein